MICPKCGAELNDGSAFCPRCGTQINPVMPNVAGSGKKRGTSTAAIVLGVVGGVLDLPSALCSGACAAGLTDSDTGNFYFVWGIIIAVITIIFSCLAKAKPTLAGIVLLICVAMGVICFGVTVNVLGLIATVLTLIGAILCFTQKKEYV
jgi:hypothetical protein